MPKNQGGKGNPASHRMSNAGRKARRATRWERARKRRDKANEATKQREQHNATLRADNIPTPWMVAKIMRAERRAAKRREAA